MLVPRTPLIVGTAIIAIPCAAFAGIEPGVTIPAMLMIAGFAVAALVDAALARGCLDGLRIYLPELIRLQKNREGVVPIRLENPSKVARIVRIGFAFPREIETAASDLTVALAPGAAMSKIDWSCTPRRRGQYFFERAFLEARSPWGFWAVRTHHPVRAELRVYPDLLSERRNVAALFLKRTALGVRAHRQAGQGREFEKLREYLHGDSVQDIHWKASAKRGHPVTKIFQVERTQEVYVIVDASRMTARAAASDDGTGGAETMAPSTQLERFVTAALILGLAAEQQGDRFGLVTFSDKVLSFVRAKNGQAHYDACRDRLYALHPQPVTPDFEELCAFIRLKLRRRALLIFLTALDDPILAESFAKSVELICRQHLVIVDMLRPSGANPLFSEGDVTTLDDLYGRLGGHLQWHQLRELQKGLQRRGVRLEQLDSARLSAQVVAQHADAKARQLV